MAILFQFLPNVVTSLQNLGFFQLLFPFLLALAIIYGVLSAVAKEWLPKSARGLISIVLGFFVMLFAANNPSIVTFYEFLGGTGLIIASVILVLIVLMGMVGLRFDQLWKKDSGSRHWIGFLALIIILFLLFSGFTGGSWFGNIFNFPSLGIGASDFWAIIVFLVILALVFWWLGKDENGEEKKPKPQ